MLFSLPTFTFAQLVKIGAGGGITQVLAPDYFTTEVSEGGYGYSTEWNLGIVGKVDLPMIPFTPRAFILYHTFTGNGNEPPELFKLTVDEGEAEFSQSILEIGIGAQYNFIPSPLGFDPYLALDLSLNNFGDATSAYFDQEITTDGFSRFGGGIGIGAEVTIIPMMNLDLYLSYKMFNLTGKEEGEETVSAITLDAFIIFNFL
jgi:hypothetical protein